MLRQDCVHFDHPFEDEDINLCWEKFNITSSAQRISDCGKCTCFRKATDEERKVSTYPKAGSADIPF
jgi:hypothetical protein